MRKLLALTLILAACAPVPEQRVDRRATAPVRINLPPMKSLPDGPVVPVSRSNQAMAQDFIDLMFALETGRELPVMTRFEGPISVRTNGALPPTLNRDLDALLRRLRNEAGIDIQRMPGSADITIEPLPVSRLSRNTLQAACFVAPGVSSWAEYTSKRGPDWTDLAVRQRMAIFVPADAAPQELRDCLHEELAQALGPVNDLYRLTDSVFNDDNFQSVLTGFDMLMLEVAYDPALKSGMTRSEVAAALPSIFARLNPRGGAVEAPLQGPNSRRSAWDDAIGSALAARSDDGARKGSASRALQLAGGDPMRTALSYFALGRALIGTDNDAAREAMTQARAIWGASPATEIYAASATLPLAANALANGQTDLAISLADSAGSAAVKGQNAALYAQFLMIKAEALRLRGQEDEAARLREDAYAYAVYGFGSDADIKRRADSIARLAMRAEP
jgi:Protein of unknown function (DUF2927)